MPPYPIKISSKGQVVIPARLRQRYGIKKGTRALWREEEGHLALIPMTPQRIREIRGSLKPAPGELSAFEALFEERARERKREDR